MKMQTFTESSGNQILIDPNLVAAVVSKGESESVIILRIPDSRGERQRYRVNQPWATVLKTLEDAAGS